HVGTPKHDGAFRAEPFLFEDRDHPCFQLAIGRVGVVQVPFDVEPKSLRQDEIVLDVGHEHTPRGKDSGRDGRDDDRTDFELAGPGRAPAAMGPTRTLPMPSIHAMLVPPLPTSTTSTVGTKTGYPGLFSSRCT